MGMSLIAPFSRLDQRHCLCGFSFQADMVEVNGVKKLVFFRHYHDGIARHAFVDGNVDAEEEKDEEQGDQDNGNGLGSLAHHRRFHSHECAGGMPNSAGMYYLGEIKSTTADITIHRKDPSLAP